jgi:hypothetical protein
MAAMPGALSYLEPIEQRELLDDLNYLNPAGDPIVLRSAFDPVPDPG